MATHFRTARDLAADESWMNSHRGFFVRGGRVIWEEAVFSERSGGYRVRISRTERDRSIVVRSRLIDPATEILLVP